MYEVLASDNLLESENPYSRFVVRFELGRLAKKAYAESLIRMI